MVINRVRNTCHLDCGQSGCHGEDKNERGLLRATGWSSQPSQSEKCNNLFVCFPSELCMFMFS